MKTGRMRLAALSVLLAVGLAPILPVRAADTTRVKATQLVKSVVLINTFVCDSPPVPGQANPVPYEKQRCDASYWKGSGSVIDAQGHILTNDHVIRPDRHGSAADPSKLGWYLIYQTLDAKELPVARFYARPIAADKNLDLAILEPAWGLDGQPIEAGTDEGMPVLPIAPTGGTVNVEDTLRLLGYPREHPLVTVSTVNVVGFENDSGLAALGTTAWIRTDVASAGPGNSGGPAVNDAGEQVGVVSAGSRNQLDCQDLNGDGQIDPVSECVTPSGGSEYIRPIPEAYQLLLQESQPSEPSPTPTSEAPPEPPMETPAPTEAAPPTEPTQTAEPTQAAAPTATAASPEPPSSGNADTAIVIGTLVSADTGDAIAKAQIVLLKPGIKVKDWTSGNAGSDAIYTWTQSDDRGNFQLPDPVQRGEKYSIVIQARGFRTIFKDDKLFATEDDPAIVDLGTIEMPAQI